MDARAVQGFGQGISQAGATYGGAAGGGKSGGGGGGMAGSAQLSQSESDDLAMNLSSLQKVNK